MSDLKPCPFCGGEAHHDSVSCWNPEEEEWIPNFWHRVICKNCGTQTKAFYTEAEAIEKWNRRVVTDTNDGSKDRTANVINRDYIGNYVFGTCSFCGAPVIQNDKYCAECGTKLDWSKDE